MTRLVYYDHTHTAPDVIEDDTAREVIREAAQHVLDISAPGLSPMMRQVIARNIAMRAVHNMPECD